MSRILLGGFEWKKSEPSDPSLFMFLVIKCPNCSKLIRFSMGGTFGLGWSLRTFYCRQCGQTHAITTFIQVEKAQVPTITFRELTESLWRKIGSQKLSKAHQHASFRVKVENPAKMLGYSTQALVQFLKSFTNIFITHVSSTKWEKALHPIELEGLLEIESKLKQIKSIVGE